MQGSYQIDITRDILRAQEEVESSYRPALAEARKTKERLSKMEESIKNLLTLPNLPRDVRDALTRILADEEVLHIRTQYLSDGSKIRTLERFKKE